MNATSMPCATSIMAAEDGNRKRKAVLVKRDYASYEEYVTHQKLKLDEMVKMKGGFSNFDIFDYRLKFYVRFRLLTKLLPSTPPSSAVGHGRAPRSKCCGTLASATPAGSI